MTRYIPLLVVILFLTGSNANAQSDVQRKSLRGLKSIFVLVEGITKDAEDAGLREAQVRTDSELRLRKAGIRVASESEAVGADSTVGMLYINIGVMRIPNTALFVVTYDLELDQDVQLVRNPSIVVSMARTYRTTPHFGTIGAQRLRDDARNSIGDMVDVFVNDYLASNPRN